MGNAASTNYAKMVSETYIKQTQTTSQNSNVNSTASAIISVSNTKGDVTISGVSSAQKVEAKAKAVFQAMNDSTIVQRISNELAQKSLAFLSDLPIGSAEAANTVEAYSNSSIAVNQDISSTCSTSASALFAINVANTGGNVKIENINVSQDVSSFQDCIQSAVNKLVADQSIKNVVDQSAKSEIKGINPGLWLLLLLPFIIILVVIAGVGYLLYQTVSQLGDQKNGLMNKNVLIGIIAALVVLIILCSVLIGTTTSAIRDARKKLAMVDQQIQALRDAPSKSPDDIITVWGSVGIQNLPCNKLTKSTAKPLGNLSGGSDGCYYALYEKTPSFTNLDSMTTWFATSGSDVVAMDIVFKDNQPACTVYKELRTPDLCRVALQACAAASMASTPLYCNIRPTVAEADLPTVERGANQLVLTTNGKFFRRNTSDTAWDLVKDSIWTGTTSPTSVIIRTDPISPDDSPKTLIVSGSIASGPYYYIDASVPATNLLSGMNVWKWVKKQDSTTFDAETGEWMLLTTIDMTPLTNEQVVPFRTNPEFVRQLNGKNRTFIYIPNEATKKDTAEKMSSLQSQRGLALTNISRLKIFRGCYIGVVVASLIGLGIVGLRLWRMRQQPLDKIVPLDTPPAGDDTAAPSAPSAENTSTAAATISPVSNNLSSLIGSVPNPFGLSLPNPSLTDPVAHPYNAPVREIL